MEFRSEWRLRMVSAWYSWLWLPQLATLSALTGSIFNNSPFACLSTSIFPLLRNTSLPVDEIYDAMVKLVKGEAFPSVQERSRAEKSASVRYWGSKWDIILQRDWHRKEVLYSKDRRILRTSEINKIITDGFIVWKGLGQESSFIHWKKTLLDSAKIKFKISSTKINLTTVEMQGVWTRLLICKLDIKLMSWI